MSPRVEKVPLLEASLREPPVVAGKACITGIKKKRANGTNMTESTLDVEIEKLEDGERYESD